MSNAETLKGFISDKLMLPSINNDDSCMCFSIAIEINNAWDKSFVYLHFSTSVLSDNRTEAYIGLLKNIITNLKFHGAESLS